jgi:osmoprotectant transport system permease protein
MNKKLRLFMFLILLALLLVVSFYQKGWEEGLQLLFPGKSQVIYPRASIAFLLWEHIKLVLLSSILSILVGVGLGIAVTRRFGREFLPLVSSLSAIGQTFPPVAVLALSVPLLGLGFEPTVFALFIYGILPILRNTIEGIEGIDKDVIMAADATGMTPFQKLIRVELPVAAPLVIAGIRISVIINIGTATVGASIGAGGLGAPITAGLIASNTAYLLQGAIPAALLAFTFDALFTLIERD